MGRTLLVTRTTHHGQFWIPNEEHLANQLTQAIIDRVFFKRRYPGFDCTLFKPDIESEVYELFVDHPSVTRIPTSQFAILLRMGVSYMIEFQEQLDQLCTHYQSEPILIPTHNDTSDRVAMVV